MQELELLNPSQRRAVEATEGRVLVLAGAGSGKTRVLTMRMAYLIRKYGVSPRSILGLTFTNKAAAEMRHRVGAHIDAASAKQITLCTFHSLCMQILRRDIHLLGYTTAFSLYDEQDVQRLINMIARDVLEQDGELPSLASTTAAIRSAKGKGLRPEEIQGTGSKWHDTFTQEVYRRLHASMRAYNAVDFDNLLWLTVELFEKFPEVLESYQERFRYLMIDEYQDTNPIQYRLAHLLSKKYQNLCVVGDDDQSIYGWRGADIKNILSFEGATVIKLEQNYRSTNVILKAANAVISHNPKRHDKVLWSDKGDGELIDVFHAPDESAEVRAVIKRIVRLHDKHGLAWGDIAILYRSNALSRQFELALMKEMTKVGDQWVQGIPYEVVGGLEFYERREVKDLCAYLRVIGNATDQEALLRIINQPRRGIGEESLDRLTAYNRQHGIPLWDVFKMLVERDERLKDVEVSTKARKGIGMFVSVIEEARTRFATGSLVDPMNWLLEAIDYKSAIEDEIKSDQMRDFKWENVQEFVSAMAAFEQSAEVEDRSLATFLSNVGLDQRTPPPAHGKRGQEDRVHLLTFHSAKGLEFPACFLVGIEEGVMPHEKSMLQTGVEEERRLMYVAITRAKRYLTISMTQRRMRMGKTVTNRPSRFLFDIPQQFIRMTDWRA